MELKFNYSDAEKELENRQKKESRWLRAKKSGHESCDDLEENVPASAKRFKKEFNANLRSQFSKKANESLDEEDDRDNFDLPIFPPPPSSILGEF